MWRALAVVTTLGGCSFLFMDVPHELTPNTRLHCESTYPMTDAVIATVSVLGSGLLLVSASRCENDSDACVATTLAALFVGIPSLVVAPFYIASAFYGSSEKDRCRGLKPQLAHLRADERKRKHAAAEDRNSESKQSPEAPELARLKESERAAADRRETEESKPPSPEALQLAAKARKAAAEGDCTTVTELDPVLRELDPETHRVWFSTDAAVAACLAAPGSGAPGSGP